MPTYYRTAVANSIASELALQDYIADPIIHPNISSRVTIQNVINRAVRQVIQEVDLKSMRREAQITPKLFDDIYDYQAPADLKEFAIIDIVPQANRTATSRFSLVPTEYFDRYKGQGKGNIVTVADDDMVKRLRIDMAVDDDSLVTATLNSTTADGGTWAVFGDANTLVQDTDNYITGGGSLKFGLTGSGTTAGIDNTSLTAFDITDYRNNGSVFVWVYINSTTNLTNFILLLGNDLTTNYFSQTITTNNEGAAFYNGWNLLRFDFASMTENGTVTNASCDSIRLYMTKTSGKSDDGYRFDHILLSSGEYHSIVYYSKYPWVNASGTYIEVSTAASDKINADTDEIDIFVAKGRQELYRELRDWEQYKVAAEEYKTLKTAYTRKYPSERLKITTYYW